jgi:hypothetical protein
MYLRELTADPLLNYLVVLSGFHEDLASDTDINRNLIYARLLKDVLDRRHAKKAQTDKVALAAVDDAKDRDSSWRQWRSPRGTAMGERRRAPRSRGFCQRILRRRGKSL